MYPVIEEYLSRRIREFDSIPSERKQQLRAVADYVRQHLNAGAKARLTFICTHNSRRSHLSQIWAKIAAEHCGLGDVETFSGGTEATAFNPRAVDSLQRSGLQIKTEDGSASNPRYLVRYDENTPPLVCFSKVYDEAPNPNSKYCAIMTCSQADEACPVVPGCELRAPIRYEDPKAADDTPAEAATYDERSAQICREMLFLMRCVSADTQ